MLIFLALSAAEQCVAVKLVADPAQSSITALPNFAAQLLVSPTEIGCLWYTMSVVGVFTPDTTLKLTKT
jgi:hypothetical protein